MVGAEIDGLAITELLAEEGDKVTRGQVLARLSRDMLDAQLAQNAASISRALAAIAQAKNQIAEAEATSRQADAAFARARTLVERGNATTETLEQREAASLVARARVLVAEDALRLAQADKELAEAQRREIQVRLARTEIKAPAAGTISRREAHLGALVSSAAEPLFRIIGGGTIEVEADVPEISLARLRVGQTALVRPAGMDEPVPARVRLVSPEVNRTSRLGRVRLSVDPVPGLAVGAFARGTVEVDRRDGTLVPLSAVLYRPEGAIIQVVRDGIVETRSVTVGLKADGKAEIRKGIDPGEQVIAISGTFVRDGDRVTPVPLVGPLQAQGRHRPDQQHSLSRSLDSHGAQCFRMVDPEPGSGAGLLHRGHAAGHRLVPGAADHPLPQYRRAGGGGHGEPVRRRPGGA